MSFSTLIYENQVIYVVKLNDQKYRRDYGNVACGDWMLLGPSVKQESWYYVPGSSKHKY